MIINIGIDKMTLTCEDLINLFLKIGGKFVCNYEKKICTILPNNIHARINKKCKKLFDRLIWDIFCYGAYFDCITYLPESEKSKKNKFVTKPIHDYQLKNTGGFVIEFICDEHGCRPLSYV